MIRCGFVSIVGRPNVGKSTLMNRLVGEKVSITSPKPQTTRHQVIGLLTQDNTQMVFVDTPGIHNARKALNKMMNEAAFAALNDVDVILFICEANHFTHEDEAVLEMLQNKGPVVCVVNKVDKYKDKTELLPFLKKLGEHFAFAEIVPISALTDKSYDGLIKIASAYMPEAEDFYYPVDKKTMQGFKFRISEIIREKLMRTLEDELPFTTTVEIEHIEQTESLLTIHALIWVERDTQKPIVIGHKGQMLKDIGIKSRADIEHVVDKRVNLKLWVKVRENWSDSLADLKNLGYSKFDNEF